MGREVKRVALDFDWPHGKVWIRRDPGEAMTPLESTQLVTEARAALSAATWHVIPDKGLAERGAVGYEGLAAPWRFVIVAFPIEDQGFPPGSRGYDGTAVKFPIVLRLPREAAQQAAALAQQQVKG